ncbi:DUF4240 domain-containing protein [Micromonospora sp. NPDC002389]|uniref:DUF4240 domain-containing protein n=1 Tax=Micromonospora sp. NPDC002389 TaxID=3154272 RepID=UPI003316A80C
MEREEFWRLVESMGPQPDDDGFDRLTAELATLSVPDIQAFEDHLAALLHGLDTHAHARAARARGDWFLYVRCAVVVSGRAAYEEVLADPHKLRRFARREAEPLLFVASHAYERSTGLPWRHESPVSYESGSNLTGWSGDDTSGRLPLWLRMIIAITRPLRRSTQPPGHD